MAKFSFALFDAAGDPLPGQACQVLSSGTSTVRASTNASDTGETLTITDNGDGTYTTTGTYGYLTSGHLQTGEYDVKVGGVLQPELTAVSHIDPDDIGNALQSASNLGDLDDAATARQNLGVEIGVDVLAYSANATSAAAWYGAYAAVGNTYPFPYFTGGAPAFLGASGLRDALGMGDIYAYDANQFVNAVNSGSSPPTASEAYEGKFWIRSGSNNFGMWVCVKTADATWEWRLLKVDDGSGSTENAYYTWA